MRLLAGWLCLSLASVWLARRMWTLRSPLTRSLYLNMTSDPGGPAAAAGGGRKETHQVQAGRLGVWAQAGGVAAPRAFPRAAPRHCAGRRRGEGHTVPGSPLPAFEKVFQVGRRAPLRLLFPRRGQRGAACSSGSPRVGAPESSIVPATAPEELVGPIVGLQGPRGSEMGEKKISPAPPQKNKPSEPSTFLILDKQQK